MSFRDLWRWPQVSVATPFLFRWRTKTLAQEPSSPLGVFIFLRTRHFENRNKKEWVDVYTFCKRLASLRHVRFWYLFVSRLFTCPLGSHHFSDWWVSFVPQLRLGVLFTALSTLSIFAGSEFPTTRSNVVINPLLHGYWISRQHLYRDIYYDTTAWCAITERRRSRTEEENFCIYIYI